MLHAGWNTLLKSRPERSGIIAVAPLVSAIVLVPFAWASYRPLSPAVLGLAVASAAAEFVYYRLLDAAYARADLGLVYPLARGSGPVYVALLGAVLLGERLGALGYVGIGLVAAGAILVNWPTGAARWQWGAFGLALATGGCIAAYSTIDKVAVGLASPPLYLALVMALTGLALTWQEGQRQSARELGAVLRQEWPTVLAVGTLIALAYLTVLWALTLAPVSLVAPLREVGIVLAVLLGRLFLGEPLTPARLGGSIVICSGVVLLSTGA